MGTIVSRLELDHPLFLAPGTDVLHDEIEAIYTALGDHIDTRYFTVEALADTATAILHHNFKSPFSSIFIKIWGWNSGTGALTEVDPADFVVTANGGLPTTDIDVQNVSGGPLDIAVTIFGSNQRLDELLNVDISGITTGQVLSYNTGTKLWTPTTVLTTISALTDTTITAPTEGQRLAFDNGTSKWINVAATPLTTRGDLIYRDASTVVRLPIGAIGKVLTSDGTDASWQDPSGGQILYDIIVDAAGGGDYTTIKAGIEAATAGQTVYVRNGNYTETAATLFPEYIKVVGESRGGVILTHDGTGAIQTFNFFAYQFGQTSIRTADNRGWDTTGVGTMTVTRGSTTVSHNGTADPGVGNGVVFGGSNQMYEVISRDTGADTFVIDEPYEGASGGGTSEVPAIFLGVPVPSVLNKRSSIENMTIINTSLAAASKIFNAAAFIKWDFKNLRLISYGDDAGVGKLFHASNGWLDCNVSDCDFVGFGSTDTQAAVNAPYIWGSAFKNIRYEGFQQERFGETYFCNFHFRSLSRIANNDFMKQQASARFYSCNWTIDEVERDCFEDNSNRLFVNSFPVNHYFGCNIKVGRNWAPACDGSLKGIGNTVEYGRWDSAGSLGVSVDSPIASDENILSNTLAPNITALQAESCVITDNFRVPSGVSVVGTPDRDNRTSPTSPYAAIVDAAGNGDYTTILAAIAGETTGTIYIKNGTYVENTQLVLKKNLHLVGESREGVLITTTANQFLLYTDQHTPSDVSQLLANRSDWDAATGDGTATVGAGSTTVTISTAAITGSETGFIILDGAPYEITSTAGPSSVFLVDAHTGSALANAPYQIRPGSFRDETRVENLTVIGSNSSGEILRVRNVVGFHAKNLKLIQDVDASAGAKVLCHSSFDCSFDKIECLNTNNSGFAANSGFKLYDNCRVKVTNSSVHRANFPVEFGDAGGFKPNYYCFFQFDNLLSNAGSVLAREASFFKSRFDVKNMRDHAGFTAMMSFTLSGCANYSEFHFGVLESGNAQRGIDQSATNNRNNIYYCGRVATAHATAIQIQSSATASETNMIQSGDFRGQISINNSVVGVCIYDSITGTPRANAGFEF